MTGSELRERRERLGLTRAALATRLGVSVRTLEKWEFGQLDGRTYGGVVDIALRYVEEHYAPDAAVPALAGAR